VAGLKKHVEITISPNVRAVSLTAFWRLGWQSKR
jgi:hypothetical protein